MEYIKRSVEDGENAREYMGDHSSGFFLIRSSRERKWNGRPFMGIFACARSREP